MCIRRALSRLASLTLPAVTLFICKGQPSSQPSGEISAATPEVSQACQFLFLMTSDSPSWLAPEATRHQLGIAQGKGREESGQVHSHVFQPRLLGSPLHQPSLESYRISAESPEVAQQIKRPKGVFYKGGALRPLNTRMHIWVRMTLTTMGKKSGAYWEWQKK